MTQQKDKQNSFSNSYRPRLLRAGVVSSLTVVGLGAMTPTVLAQTEPSGDAGALPSAQDLLSVPAASEPMAPIPSAPENLPAPASAQSEVTAPAAPSAASAQSATPTPAKGSVPSTYSDLYIDPTQYSVGATQNPQAGVMFSERSSGCEALVQPGQQIPAQLCTGAGGIAQSGMGPGTGAINQIRVGPLSFGPNGIGINSVAVQDFYNRTIRPLAVRGNGDMRLMFPLSIPAVITSVFGWRMHPISGSVRFHSGTDLGAPMGTPVVAAYSGRVANADFLQGYGLTVILDHNNATQQSLYGHLSEVFVRSGEWVKQGDVIGRVGSTGNSTGPHLHFEFRQLTQEGWVALNPGSLLETALTNFMQPFQTAQVPEKLPTLAIALNIQSLQDFGKLASDAQPEAPAKAGAAEVKPSISQ